MEKLLKDRTERQEEVQQLRKKLRGAEQELPLERHRVVFFLSLGGGGPLKMLFFIFLLVPFQTNQKWVPSTESDTDMERPHKSRI